MNDRPHIVVGVLPNVPMYPQSNDVYMPRSACPFRMDPEGLSHRGHGMATAFGRRRPGATLERAQSDLAAVGVGLQQAYPESYAASENYRLRAVPLRREFTRGFESTLTILLSTAGFVLLIVCASVANLSVARTLRREREMKLRTALGASRGRLFRQLVTESLLLSLAGGLAGLLLAFVGMGLLVEYVQRFTTRASEIRIDTSVLLFTLTISLFTGFAAGSIPVLSRRLARARPVTEARGNSPVGRRDLRRALDRGAGRRVVHAAHRGGADAPKPCQAERRRSGIQHRAGADDADRRQLHEVPPITSAGQRTSRSCSRTCARCRASRASGPAEGFR